MKKFDYLLLLPFVFACSCEPMDSPVIDDSGNEPPAEAEYEYVDLGLPSGVKWAKANIGASVEEGDGWKFSWGETERKSGYLPTDYTGYISSWTEPSETDADGFHIGEDLVHPEEWIHFGVDISGSELDVAKELWGGSWRMPTDADFQELIDNCTLTLTTKNNVKGYKVTGRNGNWIFLPQRPYWTSSLMYGEYAISVYAMSMGIARRSDGYNVRAVYSENACKVILKEAGRVFKVGESCNLEYSVLPMNKTDYTLAWSSSDSRVASVDSRGHVRILGTGTAVVTLTADGGVSDSCMIIVPQADGSHECVDLGLSVKWASANIGASVPSGQGAFFAWACTEPSASYGMGRWNNYRYAAGSQESMTKYCDATSPGYRHFIDGKQVLDPEDDAASVNWGDGWRTPTVEEVTELIQNCVWTKRLYGNMFGFEVMSRINGNAIFIPDGFYWTSSLHDSSHHAMNIDVGYYASINSNIRCNSYMIRPVCP